MKIVNRPIEMIAWFLDSGVINPVKFRIKSDEEKEKEKVIKVDKIITTTMEKIAGNRMLVFRCQSLVNDIEKIYEIKFELDTCKWVLFKI